MENQTFIEFVADLISNEFFIQQDEDWRNSIYTKLQKIFEDRLESKFKEGYQEGYVEGMNKARELLNKK